MSKFFFWVITVGVVLAAIAVVNINSISANQEAGFIDISVLAQGQANYGVDETRMVITSVSMSIVEDVIHDAQGSSSVPVILYTSFPSDPKTDTPQNEGVGVESVQEIKHNSDHVQGDTGSDDTTSDGNNSDNGHRHSNRDKDKDKENNGKRDRSHRAK